MSFLLALTPILLILFLMLVLRWGTARAGSAGYLSALVISILFFGAGARLLAFAHVRALLLALDVLLIIWAAFLLYQVANEAGAIRVIGQTLPSLTPDKGVQAIIIAWVFASFLQSVGGFGVPVAVTAPILLSLGFSPLLAVALPSIGHLWTVTYGSLGSAFQALIATTGLPAGQVAGPTAFFLGITCLVIGFEVAHLVGGRGAMRRLFLPILVLGIGMGLTQYLVAVSRLWNLSALVAGVVGFILVIPLVYWQRDKHSAQGPAIGLTGQERRALLVALSPYLILVGITLLVLLVPPVYAWLGQVKVQVEFPEVSTLFNYVTPAGPGRVIPVFRHAGVLLFYSSALAYLIYWIAGYYRSGAVRRVLSGTLTRVIAPSISVAAMITMAVIMENSGMTETLARGLASGTGRFFPFVAPWIGALGSFITGSNTNSNVMFGILQMRTADILGYSAAIILGAQSAGGALASGITPAKIAVGTSTVEMAGREADVLRKVLPYTALLILLVSLLAMAGVWLAGAR